MITAWIILSLVFLGIALFAIFMRSKNGGNNYYHGHRLPDQPESFGGVDEFDLYRK